MFTRNNFINIQGWMITDLHLKGEKLITYALIYGFSQDGESWFSGGLSYMMDVVGVSKPTMISILKSLVEDGLLEKRETETSPNIKKCEYRAILNTGKIFDGGRLKNLTGAVKKFNRLEPDNNIINPLDNNNKYNNNTPYSPPRGDAGAPTKIESEFEEFWKSYEPVMTRDGHVPKGPKKLAKERYVRARHKGATHKEIMDGAKLYLDFCESCGRLSCSVAVFLSQERWKDEYEDPNVTMGV